MLVPAVPPTLLEQPFHLQTALANGLTRNSLQAKVWRRLSREVWVHVDVPDTREMRLVAARLVLPEHAVLRGLTAAWIHGGDVRREDDLDVHAGFARGKRLRPRPGLVVCQETLDPSDYVELDGVRVTTPLRTVFDCLRLLRGGERLVVADALTHLGLVDLDELRAYFAGKRRLRYLRIGEALLELVEPLAESPMESRLRWLLLEAGLPRPVAQHEIKTPAGLFVARADLAYPEHKLAVEYDGAWHWKQRRQDERRRAAMRALGWTVLVYDASEVYGEPLRVVAEVRTALRRLRQTG